MNRDTVINGVLALVTLLTLGGVYTALLPEEIKEATDVVESREILSFSVRGSGPDALVTYQYKGEMLPEKLDDDEVVGRRTESSFTRLVRDANVAGEYEYELISYPNQIYVRESDTWWYVESAETTKEVFDRATKGKLLSRFFGERVHAQVNFYSGSGDGYTSANSHPSWASARNATTSSSVPANAVLSVAAMRITFKESTTYSITRGFLPFDTSSIPQSAFISSASLTLYATSTVTNGLNDGTDYITVVQTSQASHTTLVGDDYDNIGTTEGVDAGQRKDITSITSGNSYTFTLNATGISWIKKVGDASACSSTAGITCLGLREGHDNANSALSSNGTNGVWFSASEATGTSQDPRLSVTYRVRVAPWQFQLF